MTRRRQQLRIGVVCKKRLHLVVAFGTELKESERRFLRDRLLGAGRDRIVFAVNKADLLSERERAEVMEYATRQLESLVPGAPVMFLSATRALAGDRVGSGLEALLGKLSALLGSDRLRMLVDYAADEGLRVGDLLDRSLSVRRRALSMSSDELTRRIEAIQADAARVESVVPQRKARIDEEIAAVKAIALRDLDAFADEFASAIRVAVEKSSADDIRRFLPSFIEETWRKWLDTGAKTLGERLEKLAEETVAIVNEDAREANRQLLPLLGGDAAQLDVKVDTLAYDLSVFALGAFGMDVMFTVNALVGGLMTLAAPALAIYFRERVDAESPCASSAFPFPCRSCAPSSRRWLTAGTSKGSRRAHSRNGWLTQRCICRPAAPGASRTASSSTCSAPMPRSCRASSHSATSTRTSSPSPRMPSPAASPRSTFRRSAASCSAGWR